MNQVRSSVFNSNVWRAVALGTVAVGAGMGCEPSNSVAPGAAVMLSFGAVDVTAPSDPVGAPAYLTTVDAAGTPLIPPRSEFIAIFDRLLDPAPLETPDNVAVPGLAALTPPIAGAPLDVSTTYSPGGDSMFHVLLPEGPSFTVLPSCGLPSGSAGTVQLQMASFVSHDGKTPIALASGVTSLFAYQTQPLAVAIGVPDSTPDPAGGPDMLGKATPDTSITLSFNNLTPPGTSAMPPLAPPCTFFPALVGLAPNIHVTAAVGVAPAVPVAVPVAAVISQNPMDATQWVVAPPGTGDDGTGGAWPDGATITITVDVGAVDVFNQPLGVETTASFVAMGIAP